MTVQTITRPSNGLGTAGFVVGLIGLVLSFVPLIGVVAWPLVILGIVFSAIGISKASKGRATNKGLAIAGLVVSVIGLVICILWVAVWNKAAKEVEDEANREVVIVYEATGDVPSADITYTVAGETVETHTETVTTLPWTKEATVKGLFKEGLVRITAGAEGGNVGCRITMDGKEIEKATASGPYATADCDSFGS